MIYIYIDESGDMGDPTIPANSADFSLGLCIVNKEDVDYLSNQIKRFAIRLKKKELKFSKFSPRDVIIAISFLKQINLEHYSVYTKKTKYFHGELFFKKNIQELFDSIKLPTREKTKVFIDGTENAYFRKIYEPIIRKKFPRATVKFANSIKTPLIQVADFYAGYRRRVEKT